jgi:hypothetical protein
MKIENKNNDYVAMIEEVHKELGKVHSHLFLLSNYFKQQNLNKELLKFRYDIYSDVVSSIDDIVLAQIQSVDEIGYELKEKCS